MRVSFLLLHLLLILSCTKGSGSSNRQEPPPADTGSGPRVKVMTYNIHIANPPSKPGVVDVNAIANVINAQKPDLVALQEVDAYTRRSGVSLHEAKELARLTGMNYFFTKAIDYDGGQYGDAVLSRFPILDSVRYELPVTQTLGGELRSVAMITVQVEGKRFLFASTHLDHLAAEDNRLLQARELTKIVKDLSYPLILAGDLNAAPASQTIGILKEQLTWGCKSSCPYTFSAQNPRSTIDYILFKPIEKFNVLSYNVVNETYASDHLPLMAEIQLK